MRTTATRVLEAVEEEFRARVMLRISESARREFSLALREYADRVTPLDFTRALAVEELASAVFTPAPKDLS